MQSTRLNEDAHLTFLTGTDCVVLRNSDRDHDASTPPQPPLAEYYPIAALRQVTILANDLRQFMILLQRARLSRKGEARSRSGWAGADFFFAFASLPTLLAGRDLHPVHGAASFQLLVRR